jgi:hypothetical protein
MRIGKENREKTRSVPLAEHQMTAVAWKHVTHILVKRTASTIGEGFINVPSKRARA